MTRVAAGLAVLLASSFLMNPAGAASGGLQSGRGGASGHAAPGTGVPHLGAPRAGFSGLGRAGRGFMGPGFTRGEIGRGGEYPGERGEFRDRRGGFGRREVFGVPAFVPVPDILGLPYYDGFEYPYFSPGTGAPYAAPDLYAPDYLPRAGGFAPSPNFGLSPNEPASPQIWYYCQNPMGYYPYVRDCNEPWQMVPASVLPPAVAE